MQWPFLRVAALMAACLLLAACRPAAGVAPNEAQPATPAARVGSCSLGMPATGTPEDAVRSTIEAESRFVVSQDVEALMALWAEDARITDAHHTPQDPNDDQVVQGQDAIRYRYARFVFPSAPGSAEARDLDIHVLGDRAEVTSTTHIGSELSPGGDHWLLIRSRGCWLLNELTYNLEPNG